MDNASSRVNKTILLLASLALNIFLVAFLLGRISTPVMMPPPAFMGKHFPGAGHDTMPPPPPFFGPEALFEPREMQESFAMIRNNFEEGRKLRGKFAAQLRKDQITKEDVLKHFAEIDRAMDEVREKMQERAADKISSMSREEREKFADHLTEKSL